MFNNIIKFIKKKSTLEEQIRNSSDEELLNTSIEQLGFSVRAYNVLKSKKLKTVKDIVEFRLKNIINLPNAGIKTVKEISRIIEPFNKFMAGEELTPYDSELTFEEQIRNSFDKPLFNTPVEELDFSARAFSACRKAGLKTVEDIINFRLHNLQKVKNVNTITINNIKKEILLLPDKVLQEIEGISFINTIESIFSYITSKNLNIIKSRYGYEYERHKTLEEIGNKNGITRERVRQIIVKELGNIKHKKNRKVLESLIENIERLLLNYKGIISINDLVRDNYFNTGTQKQIRFLVNLIVGLYEEQYKIIYKNFLTNLSDDEIKKMQSQIQKAALRCQFPIDEKTFTENIIESVGPISKDYLNYHLLNKERIEKSAGKVLSLDWGTIPQRVKYLMKGIDRPMHFTEIAELYIKKFGCKKGRSKLEHSLHTRILDNKDFIIIAKGTYILRKRFKVPGNIKEIVETSKKILQNLGDISDTRYLIKELKKQKINIENFNIYSLKAFLLGYPDFIGYRKFEISINELINKYERKPLSDLICKVLLSAKTSLHSKEIWKRISKERGFKKYVVEQSLVRESRFIRISPATYTIKENISLYEEKRKFIISFAEKWSQIKNRPISAFLVSEVLKETDKIKDLSLGIVEYVLETSPKFTKMRKGFYSFCNINRDSVR